MFFGEEKLIWKLLSSVPCLKIVFSIRLSKYLMSCRSNKIKNLLNMRLCGSHRCILAFFQTNFYHFFYLLKAQKTNSFFEEGM